MWEQWLADRKRWRGLSAAMLLIGVLAIWAGRARPLSGETSSPRHAPQRGFFPPPFTLATLDGETVTPADLQGQAVVVNFWATWCAPCRAEMPALERVWEQYRSSGLTILAVNLQESPGRVSQFVEQHQLSFPILLDTDGRVFQEYHVQLYPTTFFIGRDGVIRDVVYGGPMAETLIASKVVELLEE